MSNLSIELLSIYTKSMQSKKHFAVVRVLADSGHRNKLVCTSCVSAMIYVLFEWQKLPKEFYNTLNLTLHTHLIAFRLLCRLFIMGSANFFLLPPYSGLLAIDIWSRATNLFKKRETSSVRKVWRTEKFHSKCKSLDKL